MAESEFSRSGRGRGCLWGGVKVVGFRAKGVGCIGFRVEGFVECRI